MAHPSVYSLSTYPGTPTVPYYSRPPELRTVLRMHGFKTAGQRSMTGKSRREYLESFAVHPEDVRYTPTADGWVLAASGNQIFGRVGHRLIVDLGAFDTLKACRNAIGPADSGTYDAFAYHHPEFAASSYRRRCFGVSRLLGMKWQPTPQHHVTSGFAVASASRNRTFHRTRAGGSTSQRAKKRRCRTLMSSDCSPGSLLFLQQLAALPAGATAALLDVGAHSGKFSSWLMEQAAEQAPHVQVALTLIEPQPAFGRKLSTIAARWRGTYHPAIAATQDGEAELYASSNRMSASTRRRAASRYLKTSNEAALTAQTGLHGFNSTVRAVNLARLLLDAASPAMPTATAPLLMLKLDVEASEYELVPHLLVTGALCRAAFVRIEWHLNSLEPSARLGAVGMRLGLRSMLSAGCGASGTNVIVEDEEYRPLNFGKPVPGLLKEAVRHESNGSTNGKLDDQLGIEYALTVRKKTRKPRVSFRTTNGEAGVDIETYK